MESLFEEQQAQQIKLAKLFKNFMAKAANKPNKGLATSYLERLEKEWRTCESYHKEIMALPSLDKTHPYFVSNLFEACEDSYYDVRGEFLEHIDQFAVQERVAQREADRQAAIAAHGEQSELLNSTLNPRHSKSVSLAKIEIPKFSGNPDDWENFRDMFRSLVHTRDDYPDISKFQQLRNALDDSARVIIQHIPIVEANYAKAWETINKKFENNRKQVNLYFSKLFSVKAMKSETAAELQRVFNSFLGPIESLKAINRPVKHWDDFLVYLICKRLHENVLKDWEKTLGNTTDPPPFDELKEFLQTQITTLEAIECNSHSTSSKTQISTMKRSKPSSLATAVDNKINKKCPCCEDKHALWACEKFREKTPEQRLAYVQKFKYCEKCLNKHDKICKYRRNCDICNKPHNTLIHLEKNSKIKEKSTHTTAVDDISEHESSSEESESESIKSINIAALNSNVVPLNSGVLLSTALVYVSSSNGSRVLARALVDQCSQVSLISENLCQNLKLERQKLHLPISGVGDKRSIANSKAITQVLIKPRFESTFSCAVQAAILPKITAYKPPKTKLKSSLKYLEGLLLADPDYTSNSTIDLLLGSNIHSLIVKGEIKKGKPDEPLATSTQLGWVLSGNYPQNGNSLTIPASFHCMISDEVDLNKTLQNFWRQEESPHRKFLTINEKECEEHFVNTHRRDPSGRYVVRLPFKKNSEGVDMGDSYSPSLRMLQHMERKFKNNEKFRFAYTEFLKDYLESDHMTLAADDELDQSNSFCLPHHGVLKESSTTTKLRTVFNGSVKTNLGTSLNDMLHTGENLLPNLIDLLCHWRKYEYVFAADAEKMFRQILVDERDRKFQSILWRFEKQKPVQIYRLNTVTYGLKCSPFLASRVVKQLATDHRSDFPLGAKVLSHEIYMDDVLSGAHSLTEARSKQFDTIQLCKVGGFSLRKWMSNHPALLNNLDPQLRAADHLSFDDAGFSVNILGVSWHPSDDTFHFQVQSPNTTDKITKRYILSNIAKLFDPMGWLGPVVINAKILMQQLWLLKTSWDNPLPDNMVNRWLDWQNQLPYLNKVRIPRWNNFQLDSSVVEIHGFADASKLAYGAVVYLRIINNNQVSMSLQLAKSRVAPLKTQSIPRLELLAAELLSNISHHFIQILKLEIHSTHLWTDSMDVLYWLKDHPARWDVFVGNRTSKILTLLPNAHWHYVKSKQNPADIISRGIEASQYADCTLWWQGPQWLSENTASWPTDDDFNFNSIERENSLKSFLLTNQTELIPQKPDLFKLIDESNSLPKLLRLISYCLRFVIGFILRIKRKRSFESKIFALEFFDHIPFTENPKFSHPTGEEMRYARLLCVHLTQRHYYANEISCILNKRSLKNNNPVLSLNPILVKGLLRVGGRLCYSQLDPETQHPLILPEKANLTKLIVLETHLSTLHGGTQLTLATVRKQFWVTKGRSLVRSIIDQCFICKRYSNKFNWQFMGQLPQARVTPAFPFEHSGIDYAGPVNIRLAKVRGRGTMKGWICIFVCMSTRAVHIEAVEDYTSQGFIAAFHRFTARRGHCSELYSDRGPNLRGGDRELREMFLETSSQFKQICFSLANDYTKWTFNPPRAPHAGGLWEAAVRSCKHHLKRTLGDQVLTFVELSTLLAKIEACLNSRPLLPLPDDPFEPATIFFDSRT